MSELPAAACASQGREAAAEGDKAAACGGAGGDAPSGDAGQTQGAASAAAAPLAMAPAPLAQPQPPSSVDPASLAAATAAAMATAAGLVAGGGARQDPLKTVFVGGLPHEFTEHVLRAAFLPFGALTSVRVITDQRTGRSKGYAFITFAEEAAAAAVKAMGKLDVYGRLLDLGAPQGPRLPGQGPRAGAGVIPAERRVFVGGLPRDATEALLAAFFTAFGQVLEFKIVFDPHTGCSRGFGFVAFQHAASADALKAMRSVDFFGKTLNVGEARRTGGVTSCGSVADAGALAAAYIAAGYTVMPLSAYAGAHGMHGGVNPYAGWPQLGAAEAYVSSVAQEQQRRAGSVIAQR